MEGVVTLWGEAERVRLERECEPYARAGQVIRDPGRLVLSREGRLFADGIAAALFRD